MPPLKHLAIIMDGNGRWARARGLDRSAGHRAGTETAREIVRECRKIGIPYLTFYTFSKENWSRPKQEVGFLFTLLKDFLGQELPSLLEQSIRLNVLGDIGELPLATRQVLRHAMDKTSGCSAMNLNLALNYSGRHEILRACQALLRKQVKPESLTEEMFADQLYTAGMPDPDLILRTSGELRLSNYLLFQSAYSEFYFTDVAWPDFHVPELHAALEDYASRQRRFGTTGEKPA
ncbi:MAG: di-trans,poly-cis-decaprenylcistransferase [Desulfomicrobium sp.]|nr:di-trans,poly-cis-decaprenylcistransferase [Pseudomonadota bacterium]MBV1712130.1 di-trans,poly-cis-decaprenylcistransferase [Desulfomicrobium sp.]MBU4572768.1 di-trans,poly-cis-decaprenylcistransferase [Pseudomonadota bacterium]MBU4594763.1 di-trans,poly-cis-decaprenylcistransferase [Pseudomonadota bacterium]MBV1718598.1 di-trans,poly-cis-decaprenylcistransferase [Desulfomicrobium sp.]